MGANDRGNSERLRWIEARGGFIKQYQWRSLSNSAGKMRARLFATGNFIHASVAQRVKAASLDRLIDGPLILRA